MFARVSIWQSLMLCLGAASMFGIVNPCSAQEAPRCSDEHVETLVRQLIAGEGRTGQLHWRVALHLEARRVAMAYADVDVAGAAKALGLKFSNERERGYEKEIAKRSCTADLSAEFDASSAEESVHVAPNGLVWQSDEPLLSPGSGDDFSDHVQTHDETGALKEIVDNIIKNGAAYTFDESTIRLLHENFVAAIQVYAKGLRVHLPLDYTVQVTEKGDTYVTLNQ